ncbi:S66 peptidase family protein [Streptomyces sp. NRRL S-146]|uniref:S66 peptidase family protein n=1 Tax=Streptomyces sp. NRRL S-146 TaxID=1463884 RepID=UPI0004C8408A|nr:LD-carboxypeptidase [Streptomyces sp. NRRL S-146]
MNQLVRPPRLAPGARVAVVAPSGPVPEERLQAGLDILRGWDLDPVVTPHVLGRHRELDYLAGTDEQRAADLHNAWCDPSVAAVLCARGGYGAQRMVDLLDWAAMRAAGPKVFAGFSDVTVLHQAFATRLGLVQDGDGESPYRVDRYLTQLLRTGWLDGVAGIVLGSWAGCGPYEEVRTVLADRLGGLGVPVVEEFGFGHGEGALTMPLGVAAELDAETGTLTLDEPALS